MKRNLDLIRNILLRMESKEMRGDFNYHFDGVSDEDVQYHLYLLNDAELIEVIDASSAQLRRHIICQQKLPGMGKSFLAMQETKRFGMI